MILMSDMRKWINLFESEGKWYTDEQLMNHFISDTNKIHWWEEFVYVPDQEYLYTAQDAFQKYMKYQLKPAWITDIHIKELEQNVRSAERIVSWKVITGPDDPDEY